MNGWDSDRHIRLANISCGLETRILAPVEVFYADWFYRVCLSLLLSISIMIDHTMSRGGGRMRLEIALGHNTDSDTDKKPHLSPIDFGLSKCFFFEFFFHPACFRYVANSAMQSSRLLCKTSSLYESSLLGVDAMVDYVKKYSDSSCSCWVSFFILIARHVVNTLLLLS